MASQEALYPYNDPGQLPITPVRDPDGEWLRLSIQLPGYTIWLRAWQVQVGRVVLYLLDSNDPANPPADPRHHQRAVRRRTGAAPAAGAPAGDRRLAAAARARTRARGLSSQRGARGLRGPGAGPDLHGGERPAVRRGAGGHARRQPLHHPHAGAGRLRSFRVRRSSSGTSGSTRRSGWASSPAGSSRSDGSDPDDPTSRSTWRTSPCAAAARSTASAACTAR